MPSERRRVDFILPLLISLLFFGINLFFLADFPFVHSDETWLGGLTQSMRNLGDLSATEQFFDLYERNPHAVKVLYHLIQMGAVELFGWSVLTLRTLSLLAGALTLSALYSGLYSYLERILGDPLRARIGAFTAAVLTATDIQFIYAAHTARQEIWLLLLMCSAAAVLADNPEKASSRILAGILTGSAFGFHPNAAVISMPVFVLVFATVKYWGEPGMRRQALLHFLLPYAAVAASFFLLSLQMNPNFITDYLNYGAELGVRAPYREKLTGILGFYGKIFTQESGTYYTPDVRPQFFFYSATALLAAAGSLTYPSVRRSAGPLLVSLFLMQLIFSAVGRYGQPSVVLNLPAAVSIAAVLTAVLPHRKKTRHRALILLISVLALLSALHSAVEIRRSIRENSDYTRYLEQLEEVLPDERIVLGNINTLPLFAAGELYDWRNIGVLAEQGGSFREYLDERGITHIIYPEEIDLIHTLSPAWDGLYGPISALHDEIQHVLTHEAEETAVFTSRTYAMRIVRYQQEADWKVTVYTLNP